MATLTLTRAVTQTALPAGVSYSHTVATIVDGSGATQGPSVFDPILNTVTFTIPAGEGTATATDVDTNGNTMGTPQTCQFTGGVVAPTTFPATSGLTAVVQ